MQVSEVAYGIAQYVGVGNQVTAGAQSLGAPVCGDGALGTGVTTAQEETCSLVLDHV